MSARLSLLSLHSASARFLAASTAASPTSAVPTAADVKATNRSRIAGQQPQMHALREPKRGGKAAKGLAECFHDKGSYVPFSTKLGEARQHKECERAAAGRPSPARDVDCLW